MSVDRLSNMLSSIKNSAMVGKFSLEIPYNSVCENTAQIMKEKGFLDEVKVFKEKGKVHKKVRIDIASEGGVSKITDLRRVSKPGRRIYKKSNEIRSVVGGLWNSYCFYL